MKWILVIGITLLICTSLWAEATDISWERYINAKITFQNELAELIVESNPKLEDVIETSRDLQITMVKMRQLEYYYLLDSNPDKISKDKEINQLANFDWTEEDSSNLSAVNSIYSDLKRLKGILLKKNQGHPDWPVARNSFKKIMQGDRYTEILSFLTDTISEINEGMNASR